MFNLRVYKEPADGVYMLYRYWFKFGCFVRDWSAVFACVYMGLSVNCAVVWCIYGQVMSIVLGIIYGVSAVGMTYIFVQQEERTKDQVAAELLIRRLIN